MINCNHSVSNYAILVEEFNASTLEYSNVFSNGDTNGNVLGGALWIPAEILRRIPQHGSSVQPMQIRTSWGSAALDPVDGDLRYRINAVMAPNLLVTHVHSTWFILASILSTPIASLHRLLCYSGPSACSRPSLLSKPRTFSSYRRANVQSKKKKNWLFAKEDTTRKPKNDRSFYRPKEAIRITTLEPRFFQDRDLHEIPTRSLHSPFLRGAQALIDNESNAFHPSYQYSTWHDPSMLPSATANLLLRHPPIDRSPSLRLATHADPLWLSVTQWSLIQG